jgi:hypothetical protein
MHIAAVPAGSMEGTRGGRGASVGLEVVSVGAVVVPFSSIVPSGVTDRIFGAWVSSGAAVAFGKVVLHLSMA